MQDSARPPLFAEQVPAANRRLYVRADLGDATANQGRFFDVDYSETLRSMALTVIAAQGPVRDDALVREVARAHGFAGTGHRIKQRVLELLSGVTCTTESVGTFYWPESAIPTSVPFRYHPTEEDRRSLDDIAMPELIGLVREHPALLASDDPALSLARELGLGRLASATRKRLEEAVEASERNRVLD